MIGNRKQKEADVSSFTENWQGAGAVLTILLLFVLGSLTLPVEAFTQSKAQQTTVIFNEDFEGDVWERAGDQWFGTAEASLTTDPEKVIQGEQSLRLHGGQYHMVEPALQVTPGTMLKVSFDYRVVDQPSLGEFPHTEVKLVGETKLHPHLKHNYLRIDKREGYAIPEDHEETSYIIFPWEDQVHLIFRCIGKPAITIDNVKVTRSEIVHGPDQAPALTAPEENSQISFPGLALKWDSRSSHIVVKYDIQISQTADFGNAIHEEMMVGEDWDEIQSLTYYPETELPVGKWYWRVRGTNPHGKSDWSELRSFEITPQKERQSPLIQPSADNPIFMYQTGLDGWREVIPEDIQPNAILRERDLTPGEYGEEDFWERLDEYEKLGIPVALFRFPPGPEMEDVYKKYDCVKGVVYSEEGARGHPMEELGSKIARALRLGAQYGKVVFWQDGSWRQLPWIKAGLHEETFEAMQEYSEYLIPQVKYNFAFTPLMSQQSLMGFWLTDVVDQWGSEAEGWFYHPWKDRAEFPSALYGQNIMTVIAGGASMFTPNIHRGVYGDIEGDTSVVGDDVEGYGRTYWEIVLPLYREMLHYDLIPSKEEVLAKTKEGDVVILARDEDKYNVGGKRRSITWGSGDFFSLLNGMYGMRHHGEIIPNTGDHYFVPIVNGLLPLQQNPFTHLMTTEEFQDEEKVRQYMDKHFSKDPKVESSGFATRVGHRYFISHTQEYDNQSVTYGPPKKTSEESFKVTLNKPFAETISGDLDLQQYLTIQDKGDHLRLHGGNQWSEESEYRIRASRKPTVTTEDASRIVSREWNGGQGLMTLVLDHDEGAVSLEIK